MVDGEIVEQFEIVSNVTIRAWDQGEDGIMYDWSSDGNESSELFNTVEEAKEDAKLYV